MPGLIRGIIELVKGLGIAGKHLTRHAVTLQYPEEKWTEMPSNSRGVVVLLSDKETGELNCTACELCMRACPTAAITIDAPRGEDKKKALKVFTVDNALCCYCGLCEEACTFDAIKLAPKYEFATWDKAVLTWDKDKLQQMGRDVAYEPTRVKKAPAASKPVVKTEAAEPPAAPAAPPESGSQPTQE